MRLGMVEVLHEARARRHEEERQQPTAAGGLLERSKTHRVCLA